MKKLIALAAVSLTVAACSPSDLADNLIEGAIESQDGVGDIDVDIDSDDGSIEITGEDGEVATFGGGELPDDVPFDVPGGGDVQTVLSSNDGSSVSLVYDGNEFDSLVEHFRSVYEDQSAGDEDRFTSEASNPPSASFAWNTSSGGLRTVTVTQISEDQTIVSILYGDN